MNIEKYQFMYQFQSIAPHNKKQYNITDVVNECLYSDTLTYHLSLVVLHYDIEHFAISFHYVSNNAFMWINDTVRL